MEQINVDPAVSSTPADEQEAYQVLLSRAHRKTGAIPAELLVRHVLSTTADADWPVKREALEALLRRLSFGKADGLSIASRPSAGRLLGLYVLFCVPPRRRFFRVRFNGSGRGPAGQERTDGTQRAPVKRGD